MADIAALITAVMTSLTFGVGIYKIFFEQRQNKIVLHTLLQSLYDDFTCQRDTLEEIFSDDDPTKSLEDILRPYMHALRSKSDEIIIVKKHEEICWKCLPEREITAVSEFIKELNYFFNSITAILSAAGNSKNLYEYKKFLKDSISEEQCALFGADKTLPFNIFCRQCFDKIVKDWKTVDQILK